MVTVRGVYLHNTTLLVLRLKLLAKSLYNAYKCYLLQIYIYKYVIYIYIYMHIYTYMYTSIYIYIFIPFLSIFMENLNFRT